VAREVHASAKIFARGGTFLYTDSGGPLHYSFPFGVRERGRLMAAATKKEVAEKVKKLVAEQLGVDEAEVTSSASFIDDLAADSLDQVELVMACRMPSTMSRDT
jgi:hypothetical protein